MTTIKVHYEIMYVQVVLIVLEMFFTIIFMRTAMTLVTGENEKLLATGLTGSSTSRLCDIPILNIILFNLE